MQSLKVKEIFLFLGVFCLFSCGQENTSENNFSNEIDTNKILLDTTGNVLAERNLRAQLNDYLIAFKACNSEKIYSYLYPNAFKYLLKQYPMKYPNMSAVMDSFISPINDFKKNIREYPEIQIEYEVGDFIKKVNYKSIKLYMINTFTTLKFKLETKSAKEMVIGISHDNGKNWKFVNNDSEDIYGILFLEFPQSVIDKLLSKD